MRSTVSHRLPPILIVGVILVTPVLGAGPVINEFMSSNGSTIADEDGSYEDCAFVPASDVAMPATGFGALSLAWETRRSERGAGTQIVTFTTDGSNWLPLDSYPVFDAAPQAKSFDLTGLAAAEGNPQQA